MDEYDILSQIGGGSQGTVFRVHHKPSHQDHAMKIIHCKDQAEVNSALQEIKVLLQLRNPHIVSYIDFFVHLEDGKGKKGTVAASQDISVCLVMELCHHENLQDRIRSAKSHFMEVGVHLYSEPEVVQWILQAAEALKYIHERGFLHRDMKPTNVFFSKHGNVKLGDFGLATAAGLGKHSAVGTPYYFAPELLLQQVYSNKVDVWGLGVVMLELLTLRERPINSQVIENPYEVESVVKDVVDMGFSMQLATLIRDMLNRHPDGRPTPVSIIQRLSRKSSTILSSLPRPPVLTKINLEVCSLCEVDPATFQCGDCNEAFCASCDATKHKNPKRHQHVRTLVSKHLSDAPVVHSAPVSPIVPTAPVQRKPLRESTNLTTPKLSTQGTIEVPAEMTLKQAIETVLRSTSTVKQILIAGGTTICAPIRVQLDSPLGRQIEIIGLDPTPVIEVSTQGPVLFVDCGKGVEVKCVNIRFSQSHPSGTAETQLENCERPCALEIRSGSWSFIGCKFSSASGSGAIISGCDSSPTFMESTISEVKLAGVLVTDGAQPIFRKCTLYRCDYAGMLIKKGSSPKIVDCLVSSGRETGIYCHESSPTIENCTVEKNLGCGIVVKGVAASPVIRGVKVRYNEQAGIFCSDLSTPTIAESDVSYNKKACLIVKTGSRPRVLRNTLSNGKEAGIFVCEGGEGLFEDNNIFGNANAGVLVTAKGNPRFVSNVIRKNGYEGVWVCKGGAGIFSDNDVRQNAKGPKDIASGLVVQWNSNREE